ncbi:methyltransferase domain-containing protein [Streptomyces sp. NPDC050485]|uniref:methyltransferase domain-containing protein n=1 Tax=Streptomyces sp. NPDC050485 TaxID=3365617 RepID=UPI0037ABA37B
MQDYRRSLDRCTASRTRADRPRTFSLCGNDWDLLDDVFAPVDSPSTRIALEFLGLDPASGARASGSFLEIGCGAGVIAVSAALAGHTVSAADINPAAVRNTMLNATRHRQASRLRVLHSDLFTAFHTDDRFDTVFWSSNYVLAPEDFRYRAVTESSYVDPGYATHRRYLIEAPLRVGAAGRALLHFSSRGSLTELCAIAQECGRELTIRRFSSVREGDDVVDHMLLEVGVCGREGATGPVAPAGLSA